MKCSNGSVARRSNLSTGRLEPVVPRLKRAVCGLRGKGACAAPPGAVQKPGLQIRISVNLNFELLNFKFELANLRTFLKLRTSPYRFPPIFKKCCILEKSRKNLANIWPKFSENSANFGKFCKNVQKKQQNFQQFLTKILRLESGAKECILLRYSRDFLCSPLSSKF